MPAMNLDVGYSAALEFSYFIEPFQNLQQGPLGYLMRQNKNQLSRHRRRSPEHYERYEHRERAHHRRKDEEHHRSSYRSRSPARRRQSDLGYDSPRQRRYSERSPKRQRIEEQTRGHSHHPPEVGSILQGRVRSVKAFGASLLRPSFSTGAIQSYNQPQKPTCWIGRATVPCW